jgi:hypothetical protein
MTAEEKEEDKEDQQQEEEEENEKDILDKEIESWNEHFGYALREENRILFNQMLSECQIQKKIDSTLSIYKTN